MSWPHLRHHQWAIDHNLLTMEMMKKIAPKWSGLPAA